MNTRWISSAALAFVLSLLAGCSWQVGGGTKGAMIQPTVGQQLIDLKRARETGAISQYEYETKKEQLLRVD